MMGKSQIDVFCNESGDNLLEVKGVTVYNQHGGKERIFLDEVNFKVKRGQFIALMGRSGIGKTLAIKAILGLLEEPSWKVEGNIIFYQKESVLCPITGKPCVRHNSLEHSKIDQEGNLKPHTFCPLEISSESHFWTGKVKGGVRRVPCPLGTGILSLFKKEYILKNGRYDKNLLSELRGKKIFTVFQGADTHLNPSINIAWQIGEVINPERPWKGTKGEVKRRLREVELKPDNSRSYPHQFAQGQRQRIMMAMALGQSDLLICDEPTSALDEKVKQEVIDILRGLRKKGEITSMILVTHDRKVIENLLEDDDIVFVMDKKKVGVTIVNQVGTKVGEIKDPWVKKDGYRLPFPINLHPLLESEDFRWLVRPKNIRGFSNKNTILSVKNLRQGYRQGIWRKMRWVLRGINFDVGEGEFFGIVGRSGCGKTTLAKSIVRLLNNTEGEIWYCPQRPTHQQFYTVQWRGQNLVQLQPNGNKRDSVPMRKLRREIQLIFQDSASIFNPAMTIRELFSETLEFLDIKDPNQSSNHIKETLFKLEICEDGDALEDVLSKYPMELSGGERQRLAIARNFLLDPRLVIADEPFADQDKITEKEIIQMMDRMRRNDGTTFIIISHDRDLMEKICDRIAFMEDGRISKVISPEEKGIF